MTVRPDVAVAARLTRSFQLEAINFAHIEGRLVNPADLDADLGLDWDLALVRAYWAPANGEVRSVLPFDISITGQGKLLFSIKVVVRVDYQIKAEADPVPVADDIDHFVGIMGFMHAWPYVRAETQALTAKLGLPALTLPVVVSGAVPQKVEVVRGATPTAPPAPSTKRAPKRRPTVPKAKRRQKSSQ